LIYLDREVKASEGLTDNSGVYRFADLVPGLVEVMVPESFRDGGDTLWELSEAGREKRRTVTLDGAVPAPVNVGYREEKHQILYTVRSKDDKRPVANVLVRVRKPGDEEVLDEDMTNSDGQVTLHVPHKGLYKVFVYHADQPAAKPLSEQHVSVHSTSWHEAFIDLDPAFNRANVDGNGSLAEPEIDVTAYPILTEEVSFPTPAPRSYGPGAAGTGSIGQTVEIALRDVLGWRPKAGDSKGFTAALTQSFNLKWVEGHTEATWVPRNYAVAVQADMGAITGAQASIYARAKVALDQSSPLLDGLTSLRPDILPEDQEAIRSIVRSELTQLVNELGLEGGPRAQRVDELFGYLLGLQPNSISPPVPTAEQLVYSQEWSKRVPVPLVAPKPYPPGGPWPDKTGHPLSTHLGELGLRFGMERVRVDTIEDEQDLTNFIILVDYITSLWQTWIAQRPYFNRLDKKGYEPYLGTQLVLVSRDLAVVAESVQEVNFTMDSVFLGPAERQTLQLNFSDSKNKGLTIHDLPMPPPTRSGTFTFPDGTSPLFVAELLDWIDRFTSEEGPRLIQDAGKDGVSALKPTLDWLRKFARGALIKRFRGIQDPTKTPIPDGYQTPRVQRAIRELAESLDQAYFDASPIQPLQTPDE
jgi:hypothetical protein